MTWIVFRLEMQALRIRLTRKIKSEKYSALKRDQNLMLLLARPRRVLDIFLSNGTY